MRPQATEDEKQCLASYVLINDVKAWSLWDSGSTTTGITPMFTEVAQVPVNELLDPHMLQLGTVGSRSSIKYGANTNVTIGKTTTKTYVDITNFDRYDMVIGTPFMKQNKVKLDFETNEVIINGERILAVVVINKEGDPRARRHRSTEKVHH